MNVPKVGNATEHTGKVIGSIEEVKGKVIAVEKSLTELDIPKVSTNNIYYDSNKSVSLTSKLAEKIDEENITSKVGFEGNYNKLTNKIVTNSFLDDTIKHLEGSMHFLGTTTTVITEGSTVSKVIIDGKEVTVQKGDVVNYPDVETKWFFNGVKWTLYSDVSYMIKHQEGGDISDSDIKSDANIAQSKVSGLTTIQENIDILIDDESTPGSVANQIKTAIDALDVSDTERAHQIVVAVSETNGKISVQRRVLEKQDIPTIEQSQVNNLPETIQNVRNEITNKINALDVPDVEVEHQFVSRVFESNGLINVTRKALVASDIPTIEQSQVNNLPETIQDVRDEIVEKINELNYSEATFESGDILWKISQNNGIINVTKRKLAESDLPTFSYTKISDWAQLVSNWLETDSTKPSFIKNKPTIVYDNARHCLVFNSI